MFIRILQVIAVILYIFAAIGGAAYFSLSFLWLVPLLAPAIYFIFTLEDIAPMSRIPAVPPPSPASVEYRAKIDARIQELKSGPAHRNKTQYIDSVSRGIPYSNERIDYLEFTDLLVLCEHLRPIEAAMRAARLPMENYRPGLVAVDCIMQVPRIQRHLTLDPCVVFSVETGPDNHGPDINVARCRRCGHAIEETLSGGPWPTA